MPARKQIAHLVWADAVNACGGIASSIATRLEVHRSTVYRYLKEHPELQVAMREEQETCKHLAEQNIREALMAKNLRVSMWYLARQAKDRGYGTQAKSDAKSKNSGDVQLYLPDDGRDLGEPNAVSTS